MKSYYVYTQSKGYYCTFSAFFMSFSKIIHKKLGRLKIMLDISISETIINNIKTYQLWNGYM